MLKNANRSVSIPMHKTHALMDYRSQYIFDHTESNVLFCFVVFLYEVENCSFNVCEEFDWDFGGDCSQCIDCFL